MKEARVKRGEVKAHSVRWRQRAVKNTCLVQVRIRRKTEETLEPPEQSRAQIDGYRQFCSCASRRQIWHRIRLIDREQQPRRLQATGLCFIRERMIRRLQEP